MQSSTPIGSIGFSNNSGILCPREWGAFPTNWIQTISNSTEIGTASPKITQQNLNFPLSALRSHTQVPPSLVTSNQSQVVSLIVSKKRLVTLVYLVGLILYLPWLLSQSIWDNWMLPPSFFTTTSSFSLPCAFRRLWFFRRRPRSGHLHKSCNRSPNLHRELLPDMQQSHIVSYT